MTNDDSPRVNGIDMARIPKVSLHDHLDGALRPQTIIELARDIGHKLPAGDATLLDDWFLQSCTSGRLEDYLQTFEHTTAVMQTEEGLVRVAREYVVDAAADGVVYAETRWAPEQHTRRGMSMQEAVDAVAAGLREGEAVVRDRGGRIEVRQILCAMRQNDRSLDVAQLALANRGGSVVGFDLAGPEVGFPASRHREALELLAREFFPTTIHAGEEGDLELIEDALVAGRPLRIGHGVRLVEDIDWDVDGSPLLGPVASWVRDRRIVVESCPSSNLQTAGMNDLGTEIADHPFDVFYDAGMAVTVNPDNRLMSRTSCSRELGLLVDAFGYDLGDLETFALNAADGAFLPLDEREDLADQIVHSFDGLRAE
ncbi:MAG TPA: adenosine deaminase [Pseudoclavibacter sp.]|nr:adenosine deaminase [Pseudoclavibacter sp.]